MPATTFQHDVGSPAPSDDVLRPAMLPDGALSGSLPEALRVRTGFGGVGLDLGQLPLLCGPNANTVVGGWCALDGDDPPDGVPAFMDPGDPFDNDPVLGPGRCAVCTQCVASGSPLCNFASFPGGIVTVGPLLPSGALLFSVTSGGIWSLSSAFIPRAPTLAAAVDATFGIADEVRRVFSGPLSAFSSSAYYSAVHWCPAGDSRPGCPGSWRTEAAAVFHFPKDADLDGVPDVDDTCDFTAAPTGDLDADTFGDVCDLCPYHPGHNGDQDDDGAGGDLSFLNVGGDVCDCDIDGDACTNPLATMPATVTGVIGDCVTVPGCIRPRTSCSMSGPIFDQDPSVHDGGANHDFAQEAADPYDALPVLSDHCDPDDDNDGILDDRAGDGFGVLTPCKSDPSFIDHSAVPPVSVEIACDDNCPFAHNPDQEDANRDGVGNVCDMFCPSPGAFWCDPSEDDSYGRGSADGAGPGGLIERECLADGPGCDFMSLECGAFRSFASFGWPAVGQGCGPGAGVLRAFDWLGIQRFTRAIGQLAPGGVASARYGPDINADGASDIFVGAPNLQGVGRVYALSGATGATLWQKQGTAAFGASLAFVNGSVYVGAPDASSNRGVVYVLNAANGQTLASILGPTTTMTGFGSSLAFVAPSSIAIGLPLAAQGKGEIRIMQGSTVTTTLTGELVGDYLGAGPIVPFRFRQPYAADLTEAGIAVGVPQAQGGKGFFAIYRMNGTREIAFRGSQAQNLGASVSSPFDFPGTGVTELFVGAPGTAPNNSGAVFGIGPTLVFQPAIVTGHPGDRLGISARGADRDDGGAVLLVSGSGVTHPNGTLLGAWARYEGSIGIP